MSKLQWYFNRLRKMPLPELPHRVVERLKKEYDRWFCPVPALGNESNWKIDTKDAVVLLDGERSSLFRESLIERAEDALAHRYGFFGMTCDYGDPIDWHLDPKTGKSWPVEFWNEIDHRDGHTVGGVKFGWELNRLHHWPILALAYQLTGEERFGNELFEQVESWLDGNPYHKGINWISGIELGIRVVNLVYALKYSGPNSLTIERRELVAKFISLHGWRLYRYPSKYSSCNNHAIAEALGAFTAGLCFPDLPGARKWKRFGKSVLEREVTRQLQADGSSFEHTTLYLQFVADHYLIYYLLCKEHGEPCGKAVEGRLRATLEFIRGITDENGNIPSIGDEDDGYVVRLDVCGQNNFISLLNTGAILFDRPDWILEGARYDFKTHCLLGENSEEKWDKLKEQSQPRGIGARLFENAGLAVIRGGDRECDAVLVGNGAPLGLEPLYAHGHTDALSFWLSVAGEPMFVDAGTYLYHGGGEWRDYFRSTAAHNTLRLDGQDQAVIVTDFMLDCPYSISGTRVNASNGQMEWSARHDAYHRLDDPVTHERTVTYDRDMRIFTITDRLICKDSHDVEAFFHLHPSVQVCENDNRFVLARGATRIGLSVDKKWTGRRVARGEKDPLLGWYSRGFNRLEESSTIALAARVTGGCEFVSTINLVPPESDSTS